MPAEKEEDDKEHVPVNVAKLLTRIYYNPSKVGSFGGVNILKQEVDKLIKKFEHSFPVSKRVVETWLSSQAPYVLHKRVRTRKFKRNPMKYEPDVGSLMQADTIIFSDIPHYGYKYLLLMQDTASRYLIYRFLKTKTCKEVMAKTKQIFDQIKFVPHNLLVDMGGEWYCSEFQTWADDIGLNVYSIGAGGSGKVPNLDRITRYLQERLATAFTHLETTNWVKLMPQLISSQNRTYSRSIGMTPKEAWDKRIDIGVDGEILKLHVLLPGAQAHLSAGERLLRVSILKNTVAVDQDVEGCVGVSHLQCNPWAYGNGTGHLA